jgi:hypothetical protein
MKSSVSQILRSPQFMKTVSILVIVFALAAMLNWAVLKLFGQKSEYRAEHSLVGILLLMGFFYLLRDFELSKAKIGSLFLISLLPCYVGSVFSDLDIILLGIGGHRNPLFHSGLIFYIALFLVRRYQSLVLRVIAGGFGVGFASHLLWDMLDHADVRWLPGGTLDRIWLLINGLLCLALSRMIITSRLKHRSAQ